MALGSAARGSGVSASVVRVLSDAKDIWIYLLMNLLALVLDSIPWTGHYSLMMEYCVCLAAHLGIPIQQWAPALIPCVQVLVDCDTGTCILCRAKFSQFFKMDWLARLRFCDSHSPTCRFICTSTTKFYFTQLNFRDFTAFVKIANLSTSRILIALQYSVQLLHISRWALLLLSPFSFHVFSWEEAVLQGCLRCVSLLLLQCGENMRELVFHDLLTQLSFLLSADDKETLPEGVIQVVSFVGFCRLFYYLHAGVPHSQKKITGEFWLVFVGHLLQVVFQGICLSPFKSTAWKKETCFQLCMSRTKTLCWSGHVSLVLGCWVHCGCSNGWHMCTY